MKYFCTVSLQRQVIKGIIIQAMVQSGVVMTGNADRIEAGAEAASNEILEEMKMDLRRVEPSKVQVIKKSNHP